MSRFLPAFSVLVLVAALAGLNPSPAAPAKFRQVGVIEGFYGTPWSHQDRIDMLEFMGGMGMTTYYYAPKDDPYHREKWREPYPAGKLEQFRELLAVAGKYKIDLYFALSPGLTMVYSDPKDFQALTAKLDVMTTLGFSHFALFFDDVPPVLTNEQDRARFGGTAAAQAFVIGKTQEHLLAKGADLVVCPTTYTNAWGDREYLRELGGSVDVRIPFFWTGIDIVTPEFTSSQTREWAELMSRPPLIWDNYPANDFAQWRVFLGPWRGRASDLPELSSGIVSNPMIQAHASMIPLATLAEYARDPGNYDPSRAIQASLERLFGREAATRMRPLLDVYGSYEWETGLFEPLYIPGESIQARAIGPAIRRLKDTLTALKGVSFRSDKRLSKVVAELEPFVEGTRKKLMEYVNNPAYRPEGDRLVYRSELDRISAGTAARPVKVDGRLNEWSPTGWRGLIDPNGETSTNVKVSFVHDATNLYVAVRAGAPTRARASSSGASESGRRLIVVVDMNPSGANIVDADDPILRYFIDPGKRPEVRTFKSSRFMSKMLAGSAGLVFEGDLELTAADAPAEPAVQFARSTAFAANPSGAVLEAELALPLGGQKRVRLALVVVDPQLEAEGGFSVASRNYPLNPSTFVEVELE
jgi:hypothetical protein